jgi:hypothetical protein
MQKATTIVRQHQEYVENLKAERRHLGTAGRPGWPRRTFPVQN